MARFSVAPSKNEGPYMAVSPYDPPRKFLLYRDAFCVVFGAMRPGDTVSLRHVGENAARLFRKDEQGRLVPVPVPE